LLGEDVERGLGRHDGIERAFLHCQQESGALDQFVAGQGKEAALRCAAAAVAGAADALEEGGDAAGRTDLADQVDRADVDSQLQRRRGHQRLQVAGPQARLDLVAPVLRQRAVVGADDVVAQAFTELVGQALGQAARVDEHERRVMLPHQVGDPVEDVAHLLAGGDGLQLALRQLQRQIQVTAVPGVDDGALGRRGHTGQHPGQERDGPLRRRQPDPLRTGLGRPLQTLQGERQVRAALVAGGGMDLVDDHRLHRPQHGPAPGGGDHQVQRLRRGDEEVRRAAHHEGPLAAAGVARPHRHRQFRRRVTQFGGHLGDLPQGPVEVLGDVDGQGPQRRHVGHLALPLHGLALGVGPVEAVDADQEARQGLTRPGGGGDQRVAAGGDMDPPLLLGRSRTFWKSPAEPLRHRRMLNSRGAPPGPRAFHRQPQGPRKQRRSVGDGHHS
jgi:hypothetical protein